MKLQRILLPAVLLLVVTGPALAEGSVLEQIEREVSDLYDRLSPSVVRVHATGPDGLGGEKNITVSGVVLDGRATIATLGSAVAGATKVEIQLPNGPRRPAKVLGIDARFNVGILETKPDGLVPVRPAPPDGTRVGAFAIAIGNPFGLPNSVSLGVVSGLGRQVHGFTEISGRKTSVVYYDLIQTTALINPGDSGGLLADSKGRMIGMVSSTFGRSPSMQRIRTMIRDFARRIDLDQVQFFVNALKLSEDQMAIAGLVINRLRDFQKMLRETSDDAVREGMPKGAPGADLGAQGINFALPTDQVMFTARMIRAHGRQVSVGVRVAVPDPVFYAHSQSDLRPGQGLYVRKVMPGSPAAVAGIRDQDILISFGGHSVGHPRDFRRALVRGSVTGPIEIVVLRDGERMTLSLTFK